MSRTYYTKDHEWLTLESDNVGVVGITNYAQEQLGDLVFVELPEIDREVGAGEEVGVVESVKTAADVKSPVSGKVVAQNEALADAPESVNESPMNEGWMFKVELSDVSELEGLLSEEQYQELIGG
ncbi:glycine cleavage system protein H [Hahella sp. CCB-MM4]|uniref:glycine cleavage system protein GcvH n=1 Tax=Hahella sp. (strain CCB-MM4) TaxID=1926491 RepID=UPI000B9B36B6|nr:glycine cleavage system protein GcvH [Hahella sp. CCB-MM4]OZG71802.1 glycine cleavage system protein H [Hahella sp. CCB-MM4]